MGSKRWGLGVTAIEGPGIGELWVSVEGPGIGELGVSVEGPGIGELGVSVEGPATSLFLLGGLDPELGWLSSVASMRRLFPALIFCKEMALGSVNALLMPFLIKSKNSAFLLFRNFCRKINSDR